MQKQEHVFLLVFFKPFGGEMLCLPGLAFTKEDGRTLVLEVVVIKIESLIHSILRIQNDRADYGTGGKSVILEDLGKGHIGIA